MYVHLNGFGVGVQEYATYLNDVRIATRFLKILCMLYHYRCNTNFLSGSPDFYLAL
jgi:hypothetical protein